MTNAAGAQLASSDGSGWDTVHGAGRGGFASNWSLDVEYDHLFRQQRKMNFATSVAAPH